MPEEIIAVAQQSTEASTKTKKSVKGKNMTKHNTVAASYKSHTEAEAAIRELQHSGFDLKKLSIAAPDHRMNGRMIGYYNIGDRMKYWKETRAFWGGVWGLFAIGGRGAIEASLHTLGIPKESIPQYETALKTGKFVVIAHGEEIISRIPAEAFEQCHSWSDREAVLAGT